MVISKTWQKPSLVYDSHFGLRRPTRMMNGQNVFRNANIDSHLSNRTRARTCVTTACDGGEKGPAPAAVTAHTRNTYAVHGARSATVC